jgi:hypothetical protein
MDLRLHEFRRTVGREVAIVLPVRALSDLITLFVGAGDVACEWLRERGPMAVFNGARSTVLFACNGGVSLLSSSGVVTCDVTPDYTIISGDTTISFFEGGLTTRGTPTTAGYCHIDDYTSRTYMSTDDASIFLVVTRRSHCEMCITGSHVAIHLARVGDAFAWRDVPTDLTVTNNKMTLWVYCPDKMARFGALLSTFVFPDLERSWIEVSSGQATGVIRAGTGCVHWTETSATGSPVQRRERLFPDGLEKIQPVLPFMRAHRLGVRSATSGGYTVYTFVDERTEHVASPILKGERRRRKVVRFSPM